MFSGLYGDLPEAKDSKDGDVLKSSWAASKPVAPALRKSAAVGLPTSLLRNAAGRGRGPGPVAAGPRPGRTPDPRPVLEPKAVPSSSANSLLGPAVVDEYDPARPNDYEEVRRERERQRKEAEMEAERLRLQQQQQEAEERERELLEREAAAQEAAREASAAADEERRKSLLSMSGEEAFARRGRMGRSSGFSDGPPESDGFAVPPPKTAGGPPGGGADGMSLAQKMMEKMGWKEGQGLGKMKQGMTTPLIAHKTDVRSAVIVNAQEKRGNGGLDNMPPPPEKKPKGGVVLQGNPAKVILLRNMVGPGEVDDSLEEEVGTECSKYGTVTAVEIFEVTQAGFPDTEAVRIFVEFDRIESATKALIDLEGRYFGGRTVKGNFFDEDRFERNELAPTTEEIAAL